ncbi:MAG: DUF943 family protein [Mixta calida]|uniref:DUF943 family protein n=1 Tax=Mixta calida TaxID=665913 RepID=UPI000535AF36|nr:DUF943 family protein [Mixta calida]AIX74116.1 membrane protein [Pantoea sp. PSNIH2]MDU3815069.1 DUF943 family protein [Pantoea sp.]POU51511.1 DUF943 domain-containing protein [Pantoea sp. PSNIH5]POU62916.1 DUF943 domain-containing protein [Pantoea sp. PSNIH4]POY69524.1 DUF943 domain-containing protein [Pantoea sp. PSNIH3]
MTRKNKKLTRAILIIAVIAVAWFLWLPLRPVKVIAVHNEGNYSDVLVDHFPVTVRGKIIWWQKNREMLKNRYGIPKPDSYGNYTIIFWYFGDGYTERGKYDDKLCFMEMKTPKNCIEKDKAFMVRYSENSGLYFTATDGYYYLKGNGEITKRTPD